MQYCNKSLIKNNNEILQYFNKNNDIALVMHQRALLDMSDWYGMVQRAYSKRRPRPNLVSPADTLIYIPKQMYGKKSLSC